MFAKSQAATRQQRRWTVARSERFASKNETPRWFDRRGSPRRTEHLDGAVTDGLRVGTTQVGSTRGLERSQDRGGHRTTLEDWMEAPVRREPPTETQGAGSGSPGPRLDRFDQRRSSWRLLGTFLSGDPGDMGQRSNNRFAGYRAAPTSLGSFRVQDGPHGVKVARVSTIRPIYA